MFSLFITPLILRHAADITRHYYFINIVISSLHISAGHYASLFSLLSLLSLRHYLRRIISLFSFAAITHYLRHITLLRDATLFFIIISLRRHFHAAADYFAFTLRFSCRHCFLFISLPLLMPFSMFIYLLILLPFHYFDYAMSLSALFRDWCLSPFFRHFAVTLSSFFFLIDISSSTMLLSITLYFMLSPCLIFFAISADVAALLMPWCRFRHYFRRYWLPLRRCFSLISSPCRCHFLLRLHFLMPPMFPSSWCWCFSFILFSSSLSDAAWYLCVGITFHLSFHHFIVIISLFHLRHYSLDFSSPIFFAIFADIDASSFTTFIVIAAALDPYFRCRHIFMPLMLDNRCRCAMPFSFIYYCHLFRCWCSFRWCFITLPYFDIFADYARHYFRFRHFRLRHYAFLFFHAASTCHFFLLILPSFSRWCRFSLRHVVSLFIDVILFWQDAADYFSLICLRFTPSFMLRPISLLMFLHAIIFFIISWLFMAFRHWYYYADCRFSYADAIISSYCRFAISSIVFSLQHFTPRYWCFADAADDIDMPCCWCWCYVTLMPTYFRHYFRHYALLLMLICSLRHAMPPLFMPMPIAISRRARWCYALHIFAAFARWFYYWCDGYCCHFATCFMLWCWYELRLFSMLQRCLYYVFAASLDIIAIRAMMLSPFLHALYFSLISCRLPFSRCRFIIFFIFFSLPIWRHLLSRRLLIQFHYWRLLPAIIS